MAHRSQASPPKRQGEAFRSARYRAPIRRSGWGPGSHTTLRRSHTERSAAGPGLDVQHGSRGTPGAVENRRRRATSNWPRHRQGSCHGDRCTPLHSAAHKKTARRAGTRKPEANFGRELTKAKSTKRDDRLSDHQTHLKMCSNPGTPCSVLKRSPHPCEPSTTCDHKPGARCTSS